MVIIIWHSVYIDTFSVMAIIARKLRGHWPWNTTFSNKFVCVSYLILISSTGQRTKFHRSLWGTQHDARCWVIQVYISSKNRYLKQWHWLQICSYIISIEEPADKETYGILWGTLSELNLIMVRGGRHINVFLVT